jgi:hypothetical protein
MVMFVQFCFIRISVCVWYVFQIDAIPTQSSLKFSDAIQRAARRAKDKVASGRFYEESPFMRVCVLRAFIARRPLAPFPSYPSFP